MMSFQKMQGNFSNIRRRPERQLDGAWLGGVMTLYKSLLSTLNNKRV